MFLDQASELSKKTAVKHKKPGPVIRHLAEMGLLSGRTLDYGCGHGDDAAAFGMEKWDINFGPYPIPPSNSFDVITCISVLSTLPIEHEAPILDHIRDLLTPEGVAYIACRTRKQVGIGRSGTLSRNVSLELPVEDRIGSWVIYKLTKKEALQ